MRQGARSTRGAFAGGAHFIGREACEAKPGVVDAIIAVRAHFHRASMAFVRKELLRHDAAEFVILADIAEIIQIEPCGRLADAISRASSNDVRWNTLAEVASLVKGEPDGVFG